MASNQLKVIAKGHSLDNQQSMTLAKYLVSIWSAVKVGGRITDAVNGIFFDGVKTGAYEYTIEFFSTFSNIVYLQKSAASE